MQHPAGCVPITQGMKSEQLIPQGAEVSRGLPNSHLHLNLMSPFLRGRALSSSIARSQTPQCSANSPVWARIFAPLVEIREGRGVGNHDTPSLTCQQHFRDTGAWKELMTELAFLLLHLDHTKAPLCQHSAVPMAPNTNRRFLAESLLAHWPRPSLLEPESHRHLCMAWGEAR